MVLARPASVWNLSKLQVREALENGAADERNGRSNGADGAAPASPLPRPGEAEVERFRVLVRDLIAGETRSAYEIDMRLVVWIAQLAARHNASEPLLRATVHDAETKRRFAGDHAFERRHFEYFLLLATPEEQREASRRSSLGVVA